MWAVVLPTLAVGAAIESQNLVDELTTFASAVSAKESSLERADDVA
jgi:hypothetical protein